MDLANTKPELNIVSIKYIDGSDTGIKVTLRHKSHPLVKAYEKQAVEEQLSLSDGNRTQDAFTALLTRQASMRRFVAIDSWEWPDDATFKGDKPDLETPAFLDRVCNELDWFRSNLDGHIKNEVAFHPKWKSVSAKP